MLKQKNANILAISLMAIATAWVVHISYLRFKYTKKSHRYQLSVGIAQEVSSALQAYKNKHGNYPQSNDFTEMVSNKSPLVEEGFLGENTPLYDFLGTPYEGASSSESFVIKFVGDTRYPEKYPSVVFTAK